MVKVLRTLRIEHWQCNQCGILVIENLTPREAVAMVCIACLRNRRFETTVIDGSSLRHFTDAREAGDQPARTVFNSCPIRIGDTSNLSVAKLCTASSSSSNGSVAVPGQSVSEHVSLVDIAPIIQGRMSSIGESDTIRGDILTTLKTMYFSFTKIVGIGVQQSRREAQRLLENGQVRVYEGPKKGDKRQFIVNDSVVKVQISFRFREGGLTRRWCLLREFASHFFEPELLQLKILLSQMSDVYRFAEISIDTLIALPMYHITDQHRALQTSSCAICLENFRLSVLVLEMPCQHVYHQDCILKWLAVRNYCPFCRFEMPSDAISTSQ